MLVLVLVPVAACSSGSGRADQPASSTAASTVTSMPPPSASGVGVVVLAGRASPFAITSCQLEPEPSEPAGARALVRVAGKGTTQRGVDFTVELQRFSTGTNVVTYTDTVTYIDAGRILQAQRIEVSGQVSDLRDPKAATALIRTRPGGVTARGLASAPGSGPKDGGLIGLALDVTC